MKTISILSIFIALSLASLTLAATKGPDAPYWSVLKDVFPFLFNETSTEQGIVELRASKSTRLEQGECVAVTDSSPVKNGVCKKYFTTGDKTCCTSGDYSKYINLAVKLIIKNALPPSKSPVCNQIKKEFQKKVNECKQAAGGSSASGSTAPSSGVRTNSTTSGALRRLQGVIVGANGTATAGTAGGNATVSGSATIGRSGASASSSGAQNSKSVRSIPSSTTSSGLQEIVDESDKAQDARLLKVLCDIAVKWAQMLRGILCAVCTDPDKSSALFSIETKQFNVNAAALEELTLSFIDGYKAAAATNKDCLDFLIYKKNQTKKALTCLAAEQVIISAQARVSFCNTDAECEASARANANPLSGAVLAPLVAEENASATTRVLLANERILSSSYKTTTSGGAEITPDPSEDGSLEVSGTSPTSATTQANSVSTTVSPDYAEVAAREEEAGSNIMSVLFSLIVLAAFVF